MGISEIKNVALHLIAQKVIVRENVGEEQAAWRMGICEGCDKRDRAENKCTVCGCFLDLKTGAKTNWNALKMRTEITHCPLGRWSDRETANIYREMDGKELLQ